MVPLPTASAVRVPKLFAVDMWLIPQKGQSYHAGRRLRTFRGGGALNRTLIERLQLGGKAFLTSTALRGRFALRACTSTTAARGRLDAVCRIGGEPVAAT